MPVHTGLEQAGQLHGLGVPGEEFKILTLTPSNQVAFAQLYMKNFYPDPWHNPPKIGFQLVPKPKPCIRKFCVAKKVGWGPYPTVIPEDNTP